MRVRIGISLGAAGVPGDFEAAVGLLESAGVDSLWLPENVYGPTVEPFTGMTYALAKTTRLKAGSGISVLPGVIPCSSPSSSPRSRDWHLAGCFPCSASSRRRRRSAPLFPVPPGQRGAVFDEALTLLRLMLTSDEVTFQGSFFTVDGASAGPLPAKPLDIWLGGSAPAGLRRVGRLADGWLGSLLTPAEARAAVATINAAADEAGREVDQDHFGTSLAVAFGGIPDALAASIRRRRPDADPASLVADGWAGAREMISALVEAGLSKFVIRPATQGAAIEDFIAGFTRELMPLQT